MLAVLVKTPDKPYDWKFVKDFANAARIRLELLYQTLVPDKGWDSSNASIGFSDRGDIMGNITSTPYEVLGMTSDCQDSARIYFGGKTFDTFDGRKWSKTDESKTDYATFDTLETVSAVMKSAPKSPSDYLRKVKTNVSYVGVKTACAFTPPKILTVVSDDVNRMTGGDIAFSTRRKNGDAYTIQYYRVNRDNPDFQKMLREEYVFDENIWRAALAETGQSDLTQYSYENLMAYRDEVRNVYGQPVELSPRMRAFMDDLLDGAETDMDKLERIEKLLCGYQYSNQPGDIPDTVTSPSEYLDYFVLDKKEGFCSHYATAFVLLARAEGIPARYIQGYSVYSEKTHVDVTSDKAHAWPEAYIEGYGWLGFEPTPGYKRTSGWTVMEQAGTGNYNADANYIEQYDKTVDIVKSSGINQEEPAQKRPINWKRILVPVGLCVLFLSFFLMADHARKKRKYQKMSNRDKVVTLCRKNMKMFHRMGYQRTEGETLSEYRNRVRKTVPDEILSFIDYYEKVSYTDKEICDSELESMEKISAECDSYVWHEMWKRFCARQKEARQQRHEKSASHM
ncbi:MAG: transglutaminase domain-containing protein [Clostridiales bacterium]|nr:transglutaminase domain-containing protein [Clostridiales bacterium]